MIDQTTIRAATAATTVDDVSRTVDPELKHAPPARQKTWGEKAFNWGTYGGIALLGNEAASFAISKAVDEKGVFNTHYQKFEGLFSRFSKAKAETGVLHDYVLGNPTKTLIEGGILKPRLPYLLLATVGGMLMVPFVKYAEDHKGELVRKLDRSHYGDLTDSDPKLIEAHKEMDESPKQSWSSLWKGRAITVGAAAIADFGFGWDRALSAKLFKNDKVSLNGLSRIVADNSAKWFGFSKKNPETLAKFKSSVFTGTWLLTLSSTLTVLFYVSSKLFAKKREEKIERKEEQRVLHANGIGIYADGDNDVGLAAPAEPTNEKPAETPSPVVKNVSREETISAVPQLSQGA